VRPTDIEMWLQADGVSLHGLTTTPSNRASGTTSSQQRRLHPLGVERLPYAVAVTLDRFGGWDDIGDAPQPTADAAGVVISHSLDILQQPVIVMVGGGVHYVLVTGVTLSAAGADAPPSRSPSTTRSPTGQRHPPAGSNGTETMSWDDFTDWYTANTNHGGVWAGEWF